MAAPGGDALQQPGDEQHDHVPGDEEQHQRDASSAIAAASTGRRPMWSESAPTTSSEPIRPNT